MRKLTTEIFIQRAKEKHGDYYDYKLVDYKNQLTKVDIICPKHGVFSQRPKDHFRGYGCKGCGNNTLSQEEYIKRCKKVHGNKFDYSKTRFITTKKKITVTCKKHGDFKVYAGSHLYGGHDCSKCVSENTTPKKYKYNKWDTESIIEKFREVHGDRYNYSKVSYKTYKSKVTITCPIHGDFKQSPNAHLKGQNCKKCVDGAKRNTKDKFIKAAKKIHGNTYGYGDVKYVNTRSKVTITCPIHGDFKQSPDNHLKGKGCPTCGGSKKKTTKQFIKEAKKIHGDEYDYSKSKYINANTSIIVTCPTHGDFQTTPSRHINGNQKCPYCFGRGSVVQSEWLDWLNIPHEYREYKIELKTPDNYDKIYYYVDGFDEKTNTVYEFHGDFYHGNPDIYLREDVNMKTSTTFGELYDKTMEKERVLRSMGYNFIYIWENDWNNHKTDLL